MTESWQHRRGAFNHDWLKNQFLPALGKLLRVLDGDVEDPDFERDFPDQVLGQWAGRASEAAALARECPEVLSPRTLVEDEPFAKCPPARRTWLAELIHRAWCERFQIPEKVARVVETATEADARYRDLRGQLAARPAVLREAVARFRDACLRLARAVEALPSEVKLP